MDSSNIEPVIHKINAMNTFTTTLKHIHDCTENAGENPLVHPPPLHGATAKNSSNF